MEILYRDAECVAERKRVERRHILRDQHYIVGRLIEHEQTSVAVIYQSAGRVDDTPQECVAYGILLVAVVGNLEIEEPYYVYRYEQYDKAPYYIFSFIETVIFHIRG